MTGQEKTEAERLHDHLFANYDKNVGPTWENNKTVHFGLSLIHLEMDEKHSIMVTDLWVRFAWNEPKFKWNKDDFGGISDLRVPHDLIWKPDMMLYNK